MKCPACQFENPNNAKFCEEYASPIEFHCPNCEAMPPAIGKFYQECTYHLRKPETIPPIDTSFGKKLTKIQGDKIITFNKFDIAFTYMQIGQTVTIGVKAISGDSLN